MPDAAPGRPAPSFIFQSELISWPLLQYCAGFPIEDFSRFFAGRL
jgi:hypothetical protein